MMKALKKIGFFLVTVALTLFIFWLLFLDKESKSNVLEYSLNLLGDKLMAMVPDGEDKAAVKSIYDKFVKQAEAKEVAPEQVEQVAANIFNLSNLDRKLTPEQVEAVMAYSLEMPSILDRPEEKAGELPSTPQEKFVEPRKDARFSKKMVHENWMKLGQRIKELNEFDDEMKKAMRQDEREKQLLLHYRIEPGLKVILDPEVRLKLEQMKNQQLAREMSKMEEKRLLEWRQNFQDEMENMKKELSKIQELPELEHLKNLDQFKELKALGSLEALKTLQGLEFVPPVVNVDSIQALVNRSLLEAGIDSTKKK